MIDDYSGLQKAAILLITLGPEKASAIFWILPERQFILQSLHQLRFCLFR